MCVCLRVYMNMYLCPSHSNLASVAASEVCVQHFASDDPSRLSQSLYWNLILGSLSGHHSPSAPITTGTTIFTPQPTLAWPHYLLSTTCHVLELCSFCRVSQTAP